MRRLERAAGFLSAGAGLIHFGAGPAHQAEWWVYGVFFYGAATAQIGFAVIVWTQGIEGWGGWGRVRGKLYLVGIVGNAAIILLWVITRTVGVPVGPEAGEREAAGLLDVVSTVLEVALIAVLARLRAGMSARPVTVAR